MLDVLTPARKPTATFISIHDSDSDVDDKEITIIAESRSCIPAIAVSTPTSYGKDRKGKQPARNNAVVKSTSLVFDERDLNIGVAAKQIIDLTSPAPIIVLEDDSGKELSVDYDADLELARRLDEEERQEYERMQASTSAIKNLVEDVDSDLALAAELEEQEREKYDEFVREITEKNDGIVFSVAINAVDHTLDDGTPAHPDDLERFLPWRQMFEKSAMGVKIKKFHWFVNPALEKRFEDARAILGMLDRPIDEIMLFHGTKEANVENILNVGLRIGGTCGVPLTNGAACGRGIYLTEHAPMAMQYAFGSGKIFACRVILGTQTNQIMQSVPHIEPGAEPYDCYNGGNGVYVSRCANLVLPCYMIEYHEPQNPMGMGGRMMAGAVMPMAVAPARQPRKRKASAPKQPAAKRVKVDATQIDGTAAQPSTSKSKGKGRRR